MFEKLQSHFKKAFIALPFLFFAVALFLVYGELKDIDHRSLREGLMLWPNYDVLSAVALVALNFLILAFYDLIGLAQLKIKIPFFKVLNTSFAAFSMSNLVGHALFSGGSVRMRFYANDKFTLKNVADLSMLTTITLWLGYLALCGSLLFFYSEGVVYLGFAKHFAPIIGAAMLLVVFAYLFICFKYQNRQLGRGLFNFTVPTFKSGILQVVVSCVDLYVCGLILYILLPDSVALHFAPFLAVFLLAHIAGLISQVPGGIGVFDGLLIGFLSQAAQKHEIIVALILYRLLYYMLPFAITTLGVLYIAVSKRGQKVVTLGQKSKRALGTILPQILAPLVFISGVWLLISVTTPALRERMNSISQMVPLGLVEASHFMTGIIAITLIFLSRSLFSRHAGAYLMTLLLLVAAVFTNLIKGADWEEALFLTLIFMCILPFRNVFYRKSKIIDEPFSMGWSLLIVSVVASAVMIGLFAYRKIPYDAKLWFTFDYNADASRFMRAIASVFGAAFIFSVRQLMRPPKPKFKDPTLEELSCVHEIVKSVGDTTAHLALLGDKKFMISKDRKTFIMFGIQNRSWISLCGPIGDSAQATDLTWEFFERADEYGARPVIYQFNQNRLPVCLDLGLDVFKIGEEAHLILKNFSLEGGHRKEMRQTLNRAEKDGLKFEILSPLQAQAVMTELNEVSDSWMAQKNVKEKGFSLGFFSENYMRQCEVAVIRKEGHILAFANLWVCGRQELSVDLMRYKSDAPKAIMDLLFLNIINWGKNENFEIFNLGMAPLSGVVSHRLSPLWNRTAEFIFQHGEDFYNFQGLRKYKDKFHPEWVPRYIGILGGTSRALALADVVSLISGGWRGVISK